MDANEKRKKPKPLKAKEIKPCLQIDLMVPPLICDNERVAADQKKGKATWQAHQTS